MSNKEIAILILLIIWILLSLCLMYNPKINIERSDKKYKIILQYTSAITLETKHKVLYV